MDPAIRPATAGDAAAALAVVRAVFDEYGFELEAGGYDRDLRDLDGHYLSAGHGFWLAEADGAVVGTVGLVLAAEPIEGPRGAPVEFGTDTRIGGCDCSLARLYVHPAARRGGIGSALMATAVAGAREAGRELMEIWSDKLFAEAHRLYERAGARNVGERIANDPDRSAEWGLALELAER